MEFTIKSSDGHSHLSIDIIQHSYPNATESWDANWVNTRVNLILPGYTADFIAQLRTDELEEFLKWLKIANQDLKTVARIFPKESWIELSIEPNWTAQFVVKGRITNPPGHGATLSFEFKNTQLHIIEAINQLERVLKQYPVKGKK